jgi:hypothetical protein
VFVLAGLVIVVLALTGRLAVDTAALLIGFVGGICLTGYGVWRGS